MKPDPDRTPERRIYYCHYCGGEINGMVEKYEGYFCHEDCKYEYQKMELSEWQKKHLPGDPENSTL